MHNYSQTPPYFLQFLAPACEKLCAFCSSSILSEKLDSGTTLPITHIYQSFTRKMDHRWLTDDLVFLLLCTLSFFVVFVSLLFIYIAVCLLTAYIDDILFLIASLSSIGWYLLCTRGIRINRGKPHYFLSSELAPLSTLPFSLPSSFFSVGGSWSICRQFQ